MPSAGYSSSCPYEASTLERAAREYERKASSFESEKSNYEAACSSYGYSRGDEGACGRYGYVTTAYRDAAEALDNAVGNLKRAISNVGTSCGVPREDAGLMQMILKVAEENKQLKKRLSEMGAELIRSKPPHVPTP